jgi:hypothetical protein
MAGNDSQDFLVPEVQVGDEPIEALIKKLQAEIASDCTKLLVHARKLNAGMHGNGFNLRLWETKINKVSEAQRATYSIEELKGLRRECHSLSKQLDGFGKV